MINCSFGGLARFHSPDPSAVARPQLPLFHGRLPAQARVEEGRE